MPRSERIKAVAARASRLTAPGNALDSVEWNNDNWEAAA
jgi:hypothetical protein